MLIKTSLIINTKIAAKIKLKKVTFVINNYITKKTSLQVDIHQTT